MRPHIADYLYVAVTIAFTVYGQLILKWRLGVLGKMPSELFPKLQFLISSLFDPFIFSGFVAGFLASLAWMAALSKFELSRAYPFMSLNFVIVLLLSTWLLSEPMTFAKALGVALIVAGTVVISAG